MFGAVFEKAVKLDYSRLYSQLFFRRGFHFLSTINTPSEFIVSNFGFCDNTFFYLGSIRS